MKKKTATMVAFLVTPLVASATSAILGILYGASPDWSFFYWLPVGYVFAILPTVGFGLPIYFLLNRFNMVTWWSCIAAGVLLSVLYGVVTRLPGPLLLSDLSVVVPIGLTTSFFFWLIWRSGR